jgi:DNA-binding winged helix-turn-helix (wHTH) protein
VTLRFGDCVLDGGTRELFRGSEAVHLTPKAFRLLELLLERRPNAVSKEELMEALWPGTFVAEGNLARLVAELREAIGDDGGARPLIRTIHGFGYAFPADVRSGKARPRSESPFVFKIIWADREIALAEGENVLGRDPLSAACIDVASVSRHHARILVEGGKASIEDLGSKNGTQVRGRRIDKPTEVRDGDALRLGSVPLVVRRFGGVGTTQTERSR